MYYENKAMDKNEQTMNMGYENGNILYFFLFWSKV